MTPQELEHRWWAIRIVIGMIDTWRMLRSEQGTGIEVQKKPQTVKCLRDLASSLTGLADDIEQEMEDES